VFLACGTYEMCLPCALIDVDQVNDCCMTDGADVLYNKFNVGSSSPPDNPPQHPNSNYSCVVATIGQWRVSPCDQQHRVVCQSQSHYDDILPAPGIVPIFSKSFIHTSIEFSLFCVFWCNLSLFWMSILCRL